MSVMHFIGIFMILTAGLLPDWLDPETFEKNREPMRTVFTTDRTDVFSLNGVWKFHFNETAEKRPADFFTTGYDDSSWDRIPVPGYGN